jgi:hypothetical protein
MFPFNYGFGIEELSYYEDDPDYPYKLYRLVGKSKRYISQHISLFRAMDAGTDKLKQQTTHEDLYIDTPECKTYLKEPLGWRQI